METRARNERLRAAAMPLGVEHMSRLQGYP